MKAAVDTRNESPDALGICDISKPEGRRDFGQGECHNGQLDRRDVQTTVKRIEHLGDHGRLHLDLGGQPLVHDGFGEA